MKTTRTDPNSAFVIPISKPRKKSLVQDTPYKYYNPDDIAHVFGMLEVLWFSINPGPAGGRADCQAAPWLPIRLTVVSNTTMSSQTGVFQTFVVALFSAHVVNPSGPAMTL